MANNTQTEYAVSPLEAEPGESGMTTLELSYLRAAGIDPHLLNEMDRDDVIHFLEMHPDRVENPRIGDIAALVYQFGLLREMLEGDIADDDDDDDDSDDEDDDDDKNKNRKHHRKDLRMHEQQLIGAFENAEPGEFCMRYPVPDGYSAAESPHSGLSHMERMIAELDTKKLGIALDNCDGLVAPDKTPISASDESSNTRVPGKPPETWVEAVTEEVQDAASRKADLGSAQ